MDDLLAQLDRLERRVADALRAVPGAVALACFGSRAAGASDDYADLDRILVVDDLPAARVVWPAALGLIGSVAFALRLDPAPDATAFSVAYVGESLYHKLDISLVDDANVERLLTPQPHRWLWRQAPPRDVPMLPSLHAYIPIHGTAGHLLLDACVSLVRYTRARRREQHLTCWRFARSAMDMLLRLRAAAATGPVPPPLTTWDYVALDGRLGGEERLALLQALDWSTPEKMDRARVALAWKIVALLRERAAAQGEAIPTGIEDATRAFVQEELGIDD